MMAKIQHSRLVGPAKNKEGVVEETDLELEPHTGGA